MGGALGGAWGPGFQWRVINLGTQEKLDCGWLSLDNSTFTLMPTQFLPTSKLTHTFTLTLNPQSKLST